MSNLLPKRDKKRLNIEYLFRLISIVLIFSSTTILLSIISSLPSYFLSNTKTNLVEERVNFLKTYLEEKKKTDPAPVLFQTNEKIEVLELLKIPKINESIRSILSEKRSSIKINNFNLRGTDEGARSLFVGGEARDRDSLISFAESLESVSQFMNIDLPLSNLAKNRDVDFSIVIELNQTNSE